MEHKKRRVPPQSGDRFVDCIFRMIMGALESISVKKTKEIYNPENPHEKNICGIISSKKNEIYLNAKRHKKINEPIVSTLIHEVLHVLMPDVRERCIRQFETVLYIRLTDSQKRYLRVYYIPKHTIKATSTDSIKATSTDSI